MTAASYLYHHDVVTLIVDLSVTPPGRFAARLAGLSGDDVVRYTASTTNGKPDRRGGIREAYLSDGVRVSSVDWSEPADRRRVEADIRRADAVISSFSEGCFDSPYAPERVRTLNPDAVHLVVSPFGLDGPYRNYHTSSLTDWAAGGYLYITGDPGRAPLPGPRDVCAYATGYMAAIAVEAGLAAVRSGLPAGTLDVSHMETMLSLHQLAFPRLAAGEVMTRTGHSVGPATYPHGSYPTLDGELFVGIVTDDEWDRFLIAIDRPELCQDVRLATGQARKSNAELTDEVVRSWTARRGTAEAAAFLQAMRVPATECATPRDLLSDAQLEHRGYFRTRACSSGGHQVRLAGNPLGAPRRAPTGDAGDALSAAPPERALPPATNEPVLPLSGVTVLDMSLWWAGPMAARILGDLGADVIRIERPTLPRDESAWPLAQRFVHEQVNRNKRSIMVDLTVPEGLSIVRRLMSRADVFIQNFRPGVMEKLGLGWEEALEANHRLVYVSLSGYGSDGPKSSWGTYGTLSEAASSVRSLTHYPGEGGMRLGDQLPDAICGLAGALAALRGLRMRSRTGAGCAFDISQLEAYVALVGEEVAAASLGDSSSDCADSSSDYAEGTFGSEEDIVIRCLGADEWVAVTLPPEADLGDLAARLGDPTRRSAGAREQLEAHAARASKQSVAATLQDLGVPAFPVATARDILEDPHVQARGSFVQTSVAGTTGWLARSPLRSSGHPLTGFRRDAPIEGEQTLEILRDDLGFSEETVQRLVEERTVRQNTR